jgi:CHAT domain-containing protein
MLRFAAALLLLLLCATPARAEICAFGASAAELREEGYCTAQAALRSTIARSLASLEARMAIGDTRFAAVLRRAQDLRAQRDAFAAAERSARGDKDADAPSRVARIAEQRRTASAALLAVESDIARDYPRWIELTRPAPLREAETLRLLRPGELMLFWHVGEDASFVWAIGDGRARWARIPLGAAPLRARIAQLRASMGVDGPQRGGAAVARTAFDRDTAAELFAALFPGEIARAARKARTLLLVPGGPLTSLPFAALPMGARTDSRWLGLEKPLAVLPAPTALRVLRATPATIREHTPFAGFGAPVLGEAAPGVAGRGLALPPLPEAEAELYELAAALRAPVSSVRIGALATERQVKATDLSDVRVLAFATHGLVAGEAGAAFEPALVFTAPGVATEEDDGLLTASEAARLHLSADWVILSACNTAAGGRSDAEALSGLASAFTYAGARGLLVSHWAVRDDAARRITTRTVAERRLGRAEALRRAMKAVAGDRRHPEWRSPAVWAVFQLVGDPDR